ncbi:MAG TPA: acyltransferase [Sphingomonas sp.]|uniref:acyltransferase n=1 Tax=Sphingomonas sp. TaxID=28214 RepID=UPI002C1E814B|nr:acyltransferase [Sphingomonas sp.]HMI20336.1 acyltransferase [Sphingomonas sp.]
MTTAISGNVPTRAAAAPSRNLAINYLRAFVTLLVVAHHSVLAYMPEAPTPGRFDEPPFLWAAFPIVDRPGWPGFTAFAGFNDVFFMALMFFLSGLFVPASLARRGAGGFARERLLRLGIPFLVGALLLAPLAYYPSYAAQAPHASAGDYLRTWLALPHWSSGPVWFLAALLLFGLIAAGLQATRPGWLAGLASLGAGADRKPARFFAGLLLVSALAYGILCAAFGPAAWLQFGPFAIQSSRILHYLVYFGAGIAVGAAGLEAGLLAPAGLLARRWWAWALLALVAFVAATAIVIAAAVTKGQPPLLWAVIGPVAFALSCAASSFMLLAIFRRFVKRERAAFDSLAANAYAIYVLHYGFVVWLQFALLGTHLGSFAKGVLVFAAAVALSWASAALLRRLPAVARIL